MKKILILFMLFIVLGIGKDIHADGFLDVKDDAFYSDAVHNLYSLGIMNGVGQGKFEPDEKLTREQFAVVLVKSMVLENEALSLSGSTYFADVSPNSWSSGFVNLSVEKGILRGMLDGDFHPTQDVTLAQVATVIVRLLGYDDTHLDGIWPQNYIHKATKLGLLENIEASNNDSLTRGQISVILDRLFDTKMKNSDEPFSKYYGLFVEGLVLGNYDSFDYLEKDFIVTDIGAFDAQGFYSEFKIGQVKRFKVNEEGQVLKIYKNTREIFEFELIDFDYNSLSFKKGTRNLSLELFLRADYYYNGKKINYNEMHSALKKGMKVILSYEDDALNYESMILIDPDYIELGSYGEYVIVADSSTKENLGEGFILTDDGKFFYRGNDNLEVGYRYGLIIRDEEIIESTNKRNETTAITVNRILGSSLEYSAGKTWETLVLPDNIEYYHNGKSLDLYQARGIIEKNSTLIFGKAYGKGYFEYVVIIDPLYSKPHIVKSYINEKKLFTDFGVTNSSIIIKNYEISTVHDIAPDDVLYIVGDYKEQDKFVFIIDTKVEGELIDILPNKISPQKIKVDNKEYYLSENFQTHMSDNIISEIEKGEDVYLILDKHGDILSINRLISRTGNQKEVIVVANSLTNSNLSQNQIITNMGMYNLEISSLNFKIGKEYNVWVDEQTIIRSEEIDTQTDYFVIERASGNIITQRIQKSTNEVVYSEMRLPYGIKYYYNEDVLSYSNVVEKVETNSSIVFAKNLRGTGYKYGIVIDPIYSRHSILNRTPHSGEIVGDVEFTRNVRIIKNGSSVSIIELGFEDVVYQVSDYKGISKYILAFNENINGRLQDIKPNVLSPREIKIDGRWFRLSSDANIETFINDANRIQIGDYVRVFIGIDGEAVYVR